MATYPDLSVSDLAEFSGRPVTEYTNPGFVPNALAQAVLLFQIGTCLGENDWPDDPTKAMLAQMAILAMADAIYLSQPFQATLANPFSSETIGSYSYSKVSGAILSGIPTGVSWFDLATERLSVCHLTNGIPEGGGIEAFEHDGLFTDGRLDGNTRLLGPNDINRWDGPYGGGIF